MWRYKFLNLPRDLTLFTWSKGHVVLKVGASQDKSEPYLVRCPWVFYKWKYNRFNLWRDLTRPPHWGVVQIYRWEFFAVCHDLDKFGDHKHYESGNMFLICHLTSPAHYVTLWVKASHGESPSCDVGGYWLCESRDIKYFICHVIFLQNHMIEGSCNSMSGNSSLHVTTLPSLVAINIVIVEVFLLCHVI